jgi:hypothetical protein
MCRRSESYQLCGHLTAAAAAGEDEPADGQAGADFLLSFESQTLVAMGGNVNPAPLFVLYDNH